MPDVFLSYSRSDQPVARRFAEELQRQGFSVWWDQALNAGESFDKVTEQALRDARAVVVLWSRRAVESDWVRAEATQAKARGTLVPVAIEPCERPILFELTHTADLAGWNGDITDPRWRAFIDGLRRVTGLQASAPASAATPEPATAAAISKPSRRRALAWSAAAAALLLAAGAGWFFLRDAPAEQTTPSIAVLPFENLSDDPDQGHFADGLTEQILDSLARIPGLQVTARTSAFAFKGKAQDLKDVGRQLGVAHVLEGSVNRSGEKLRITVQLIRTDTGFHLWSRQYDRPFAQIFEIQEDIAQSVAKTLQVTLGVGVGRQPGMTRNADAYDAYLLGIADPDITLGRMGALRNAIAQMEKAVALDPSFADAWVVLSQMYETAPRALGADEEESRKAATAALEKARALVPDLPRVLFTLAYRAWYARRYEESMAHVQAWKNALRKYRDPGGNTDDSTNIPPAFRSDVGRLREHLAGLEQSLARLKVNDPLNFQDSALTAMELADAYSRAGRFSDAFAHAERGYKLTDSANSPVKQALASTGLYAALAADDHTETLRWLSAVETDTSDATVREVSRQMRELLGQREQALRVLHDRARDPSLKPIARTRALAPWLAYYGDARGAWQVLNMKTLSQAPIAWSALFADVRKLPEFKQYVSDVGLVEIWRKTGWGDFCKPVEGSEDFTCQ